MKNQQAYSTSANVLSTDRDTSLDSAAQSIPFLVFDVHDADGWDSLDMPTILVAQQVLIALSEREEILAELELDPSDVQAALTRISYMRDRSEGALVNVA